MVSEWVFRLPRLVSSQHNRHVTGSHLTSCSSQRLTAGLLYASRRTCVVSNRRCTSLIPYHSAWPRRDVLATLHASMPCTPSGADMRCAGSPHRTWHSTCTPQKTTNTHRARSSASAALAGDHTRQLVVRRKGRRDSIISPGTEAMLKVYGVGMMMRDFVLWCRPHQQPSTLCTLLHRCLSRGSLGPHAHGQRAVYAWGSTFD